MKVLVIGGGGREHALAWKIAQSERVRRVYCAPGNPATGALPKGENVRLKVDDFEGLKQFVADAEIDLVVVGPEDPLAAGIVDFLQDDGCTVFGPCKAAAQIEGSKAFAKDFMQRHNIPTAAYAAFEDAEAAKAYVREQGAPIVVKADGLAAGKGVTVAHDVETAEQAIQEIMVDSVFGSAGASIVIEEFLDGEEASILAFCDGKTIVPMVTSQDHKPALDGDKGPNTGGMGAYSPAPVVTDALEKEILDTILRPALDGMASDGTPYVGILYAGLMITASGPKVVEFNCRFGDPETQVVLPRMASDIVDVFVACCDGTLAETQIEYDPRPCVTVVMASGGYPKAYKKGKLIEGVEAAEQDEDVVVFHAGTALEGGALVTAGGRVLTVTASAETLTAAIDKAYAGVGKIHFEGAHWRTDIAQKALKRLQS
jgi:phosphoribosylamine--glycine ligase